MVTTKSRHKIIDGLICKRCGELFSAREQRVKAGLGIFCSRKCSSLWKSEQSEKLYVGKENGKLTFDSAKNSYYVYWFDPDTLIRKTSSYSHWWWEVYKGEIPSGYRASYKDGNRLNMSDDNIILISSDEFGASISRRLIGREFSDETKQKMSLAKKGKPLTDEHKNHIGEQTKRMWKDGVFDAPEIREAYSKQGKSTKGSKRTEEQKKKMSENHKGMVIANSFTPEAIEKRRQKLIGSRQTLESNIKRSEKLKGRKFTDEHLSNLSDAGKNRKDLKGENSRWWKGGTTFDPYPDDFSDYLRRKIRKRDNNKCQSCGVDVYRSRLGHVHHIDADKQNCDPNNLLLLCASCHNAVHGRNTLTNDKIEQLKLLLKL